MYRPFAYPTHIWLTVGFVTMRQVMYGNTFDDLWLDTEWAVAKEAGLPEFPTLGDLLLATAIKRRVF